MRGVKKPLIFKNKRINTKMKKTKTELLNDIEACEWLIVEYQQKTGLNSDEYFENLYNITQKMANIQAEIIERFT